MNNIYNILNQLKQYGSTPEQIAQNLMMRNQDFKNFVNQINSSGLSPEQLMKQYNIDINQLKQMASQLGIKV